MLVQENSPHGKTLPPWISVSYGNVCDDKSLSRFFSDADGESCVIHCAGIVSVASRPGDIIYQVNVGGTARIIRYCEQKKVGKLVHVSSVHAIPEKPIGMVMTEETVFSPEKVRGDYARSKAIATSLVLEAAERGLNASVVFPSGIIGPGEREIGSISHLILSFLAGKLPFAVKGGYDFVDVRDVASGIAACARLGEAGKGYILSGHYATIRDILEAARESAGSKHTVSYLPIRLAKLVAPFYEKWSIRKKQSLFFTPYSVAVLASNANFSHEAAAAAFAYAPRSIKSSIQDMILWLTRKP